MTTLIEKLRQIEALKVGASWPDWMETPNGWGGPLSQLAGEAADALEPQPIDTAPKDGTRILASCLSGSDTQTLRHTRC